MTPKKPKVSALAAALGPEVQEIVTSQTDVLTSASSPACERVAATHRLNELFTTACSDYSAAVTLAGGVSSLPVMVALLEMLVEGTSPGAEIAVQLMTMLSVDRTACTTLERAGVLPVLVAALRPSEPSLRAWGLRLLATLAEIPSLAQPIVRAGVVKLLGVLAASTDPEVWHWLLEICLGLMQGTQQPIKPAQRRRLLEVLEAAYECTRVGELELRPRDAKALQRVLGLLRAMATAAPPAGGAKGGGGGKSAQPPERELGHFGFGNHNGR